MRKRLEHAACLSALLIWIATPGATANKETIATVDAYSGENEVRVDVFCHNETGLLEYFNLIVFDDSKLEFAGIEADRGGLWYGAYPTHVDGNRIYVHGAASAPSCISPDLGDPGSPLFHINFNVKPGVEAGVAEVVFDSEGVWDGHWNDCGGYTVTPPPDYYDGAVNVLGHAGVVTIESDSASAGHQAVVDVYLHNDLDVFEYFNQILFDDAVAGVDSVVAVRGVLHYGYYPTHVDGDTIFVHGWAGSGGCFYADHSYPGAALYRIYFTIQESAPPGYTMPVIHLDGSPVWDHWVGCDLNTTDSFGATDGAVYVRIPTGARSDRPVSAGVHLGPIAPNPTARGAAVHYYLSRPGHVSVVIYDARGSAVKVLENARRDKGAHLLTWDGTDEGGKEISSGVYFVRLRAGSSTYSRKVTVLK